MSADADLARHVPLLLNRARALLRLPGGPSDRLAPNEIAPAARAVDALHLGLVGDRTLARPETYDERQALGAYLLWWWPQSYVKTRAALQLLPEGTLERGRVLDLGSGPGPAALAALDATWAPEVVALDASGAALDEAKAIATGMPLSVRHWKLGKGPLPLLPDDRYQLVTAANLLSELPGAPLERAALIADVIDRHLSPGGIFLALEPALRETGRELLEVRDRLLELGLRALAPCFTQGPCPALASGKDWCTASQVWEPPEHVRQLADATGLRADELLSFAPLAVARSAPATDPAVFRVVGVPRPEKGKSRAFVCGVPGRDAVVLLEKHRTEANGALLDVSHGDLVRLGGLERKGDGWRLKPESRVERLEDRGAPPFAGALVALGAPANDDAHVQEHAHEDRHEHAREDEHGSAAEGSADRDAD